MSELNVLIENYKSMIPNGKIKTIIMKTCNKIRLRALNFQYTSSFLHDAAAFDELFYGLIYEQWKEEIDHYILDDPYNMYIELFMDFRNAVHRILAEHNYTNKV